jgi:chemotaxis signal transduction protein
MPELGTMLGGIESVSNEPLSAARTVIGPKQWFCLFRSDAGPMAVAVESVAEVLETETLVPMPWSPPHVVGLCSYHREVVPVVKLSPFPHEFGDAPKEQGQPKGTDTGSKTVSDDERAGCVVLILKTEQGVWGIRVDSGNTIMSRESAEYQSPRVCANGPVLVGSIDVAETRYIVLDAEATWHGLRSAVDAWSRLRGSP